MPKSPKKGKWYAVRHGREGAKIYDNWGEVIIPLHIFFCSRMLTHMPGRNKCRVNCYRMSGVDPNIVGRSLAFQEQFTNHSEASRMQRIGSLPVL